MSAASSPAWGRAAALLSIFTVTAARWSLSGSVWGRPVSGAWGGRVVVVVAGAVVVARPWAAFLPPPQAAVTISRATARTKVVRRAPRRA